jgi:hypothetical protein
MKNRPLILQTLTRSDKVPQLLMSPRHVNHHVVRVVRLVRAGVDFMKLFRPEFTGTKKIKSVKHNFVNSVL